MKTSVMPRRLLRMAMFWLWSRLGSFSIKYQLMKICCNCGDTVKCLENFQEVVRIGLKEARMIAVSMGFP